MFYDFYCPECGKEEERNVLSEERDSQHCNKCQTILKRRLSVPTIGSVATNNLWKRAEAVHNSLIKRGSKGLK